MNMIIIAATMLISRVVLAHQSSTTGTAHAVEHIHMIIAVTPIVLAAVILKFRRSDTK